MVGRETSSVASAVRAEGPSRRSLFFVSLVARSDVWVYSYFEVSHVDNSMSTAQSPVLFQTVASNPQKKE